VLLHACNFRWAKNITLSHETGIFWPDMKMLKVHQNAPTSMLKSQIFSGVIPPDPRIKRGREGGEGLGREGIGVWPTQKLSRGAPYGVALLNFCRYRIHIGEQLAVVQFEYEEN
jgi:hypothetical protein